MIDLTPLLARLTPEEREILRDWRAHVPPAPSPDMEEWLTGCFIRMPLPFALGVLYQHVNQVSQLVVPLLEVMKPYAGRLDLIEAGKAEAAALREQERRRMETG